MKTVKWGPQKVKRLYSLLKLKKNVHKSRAKKVKGNKNWAKRANNGQSGQKKTNNGQRAKKLIHLMKTYTC